MSPRVQLSTGKASVFLGRVRSLNAAPRSRPFLRISCAGQRSAYSTESGSANAGPVVRVTDIPAPNSGHIRILELNRPAARNAISRALLYSLREEIDAVHAQYDAATGDEIPQPSWQKRFGGVAGEDKKGPTRALIIASAVDTSFCAGADLKERKEFTPEECVYLPHSRRPKTFSSAH
jgi:methylglutaconyl-CoA hydratase